MTELADLCRSLQAMDTRTTAAVVDWVTRCERCPERNTCGQRITCPGQLAQRRTQHAEEQQALEDLRQLGSRSG